MKYFPLFLLALNGCCISPSWRDCGLNDFAQADYDQTALALPRENLEDRVAKLKALLEKYPKTYEYYFNDSPKYPPEAGVGWFYVGKWEEFSIWARRRKESA